MRIPPQEPFDQLKPILTFAGRRNSVRSCAERSYDSVKTHSHLCRGEKLFFLLIAVLVAPFKPIPTFAFAGRRNPVAGWLEIKNEVKTHFYPCRQEKSGVSCDLSGRESVKTHSHLVKWEKPSTLRCFN